jgi:aspartokinase
LRGTEPQTDFEKPRGVSRVEVRDGYAQAIVEGLTANSSTDRLGVLKAIAEAGVSLDFLKLAPTWLSFLVPAPKATLTDEALRALGVSYQLHAPRSIVMVHAVNMRDEEGLISQIVSTAIATGLTLEHLGDMHDRMLIVLESEDAKKLAAHLNAQLAGVAA